MRTTDMTSSRKDVVAVVQANLITITTMVPTCPSPSPRLSAPGRAPSIRPGADMPITLSTAYGQTLAVVKIGIA